MLIGLTGSMAAGKSTAARTIAEMGFPVIDADRIAHEVLEDEKVISELVKEFGSGIISGGRVDRKALSAAAFQGGRTERLNSITHPVICQRLIFDAKREEEKHGVAVLDVPLLIESGLNGACAHVILITADKAIRYARIMERDGLTVREARARLKKQMPERQKRKYADIIIENNGTAEELEAEVRRVMTEFMPKGKTVGKEKD